MGFNRNIMANFTKTNKWLNFKKKASTPVEKELMSYIELLERQIEALEVLVNKCVMKDEEVSDDRK